MVSFSIVFFCTLRNLRDPRAGMGFYQRQIRAIDRAIDGHVRAEVRYTQRQTGLHFRLCNIRGINNFVPVRVAEQNVHADTGVGKHLRKRSVTLLNIIVIFCASVTFVRLTVIVLPLKLGVPETLPLPPVMLALPAMMLLTNVKTSVWPAAPERHSTPGVPESGKAMSKAPATPWVLRETAETELQRLRRSARS